MKVLDTDTCIGLLRGHTEVIERRLAETDEVATTWVTASELFYGAAKSVKPDANGALVVRFLATLPVLGLDLASARVFGEVKARLASQGQIVADADLFIGSVALSRGAAIVTGNRRHYDRLPGLVVEDWLRS
ncbi:MAG: PIN domain-containing protein [Pseudomonadota bacterium]|nr:PIN domain-containing protein [Pseudomonadota bacterium]